MDGESTPPPPHDNRAHLIDPIPETSPQGINKGLIPHPFNDDTPATRPSSTEPILGTPFLFKDELEEPTQLITPVKYIPTKVYTSSEEDMDCAQEISCSSSELSRPRDVCI